jgi:Xaa-Pro aminopeptidase
VDGVLIVQGKVSIREDEDAKIIANDLLLYEDIPMDAKLSDVINSQRKIKSADELADMRSAQRVAEKAFDHILGFIEAGKTEKEIALELEMYSRRNGSDYNSFSYIVASGPNSSMPHAVPGERKVQNGDFITMDFGCSINGYCSDMTRTVALGTVTDKQREVYELVLNAQKAALAIIKPGVANKAVDAAARDMIDASPYAGMFGHGLGHSLGLAVHEEPRFSKLDESFLEPGLVLSVEPGVYIPGEFGVRIEDVVAITGDGYENLMKTPKDLLVL